MTNPLTTYTSVDIQNHLHGPRTYTRCPVCNEPMTGTCGLCAILNDPLKMDALSDLFDAARRAAREEATPEEMGEVFYDEEFERTRAERWTALSIEEQDTVVLATEAEHERRYDAGAYRRV